ncbi:MAG TPA: uracil-DNA glycosylase family protein [Candidatus Eisenbacteria bacterium]|nr:uracil-DNA glycosylase family protein [Candidatus Eisenbacteria bacterium]
MGERDELLVLQAECRACHVCVDDGIIPEANPTFEGRWGAPFFLVGQAPGPVERESRRPFSGRAGKELDRWMVRAGFESAEEFRRFTYIAALMRCFPGRNRTGSGDLKPPPAAVANCAHWLDAELRLIKPKVLILVGQLAIARFLGPGPLEDRVGHHFGDGPVMVPLPHPSGQSRWLNDPANRERLVGALEILGQLRMSLAPAPRSRSNNDGGSQKPPRVRRATTKAMRRKA